MTTCLDGPIEVRGTGTFPWTTRYALVLNGKMLIYTKAKAASGPPLLEIDLSKVTDVSTREKGKKNEFRFIISMGEEQCQLRTSSAAARFGWMHVLEDQISALNGMEDRRPSVVAFGEGGSEPGSGESPFTSVNDEMSLSGHNNGELSPLSLEIPDTPEKTSSPAPMESPRAIGKTRRRLTLGKNHDGQGKLLHKEGNLTPSEEADFQRWAEEIKNHKLPKSQLLLFYGLYKQALFGDVDTPCPKKREMRERAKWKAWESQSGKSATQCKREYVAECLELMELVGEEVPQPEGSPPANSSNTLAVPSPDGVPKPGVVTRRKTMKRNLKKSASCVFSCQMEPIPKFKGEDNYSIAAVEARQKYLDTQVRQDLRHVTGYTFDPKAVSGNCENFIGVAQIPLGIAGPLKVNGEHAKGEFVIPMATCEGTLVASYSRGMKLLNMCGGVTCTVLDDRMQRAPVFEFRSAREGKKFMAWIEENFETLREHAEETSNHAKLLDIDPYALNKVVYLRFNFFTGDAAGQNMVTRATSAAVEWIMDTNEDVIRVFLDGNIATDKKPSHINSLKTRGKRVVAEVTLTREELWSTLRVTPEDMARYYALGNQGAFLAGSLTNGAHTANGVAAMYLACGQDVANVAESCSATTFVEVTDGGDLYYSNTIPAMIVATHGGGTALPTQAECLRILQCTERGSAPKLAEIVAGVVLAGEISLTGAIVANEWVSAHEVLGRNK